MFWVYKKKELVRIFPLQWFCQFEDNTEDQRLFLISISPLFKRFDIIKQNCVSKTHISFATNRILLEVIKLQLIQISFEYCRIIVLIGYVISLQHNNEGYKERQLNSSSFIDGPTFPAQVSLS